MTPIRSSTLRRTNPRLRGIGAADRSLLRLWRSCASAPRAIQRFALQLSPALLFCLFVAGCSSSSSGSGAAATTPAESPPPEVEARWTFDAISGGLILDNGSGGFHGEVFNATIDADGRVDGALSLSGSSRMVVDASALELSKWDAITVVSWIRTATTASGSRAVVAFGDLPQPSFALTHLGTAYQFGVTGRGEVSGGSIVADRWTHVAASYGGGRLNLYLDGALVDSATVPPGTLPPALADLGIGAESDGDNGFSGAIDELSIYSRELSAAEILTLFTSTPPEPIEASDADAITLRDVPVEVELVIDGPDPDAIEVDFVDLPPAGAVEWIASGPGAPWIARYTPPIGFVGTETFTYQAFVGTQLSNVATVTVEVTPPPARGRVQIVDNNIVTDNGLPLRGDTITLADWNLDIFLNPHHWLEFRDDFNLNTIRLLVSRPPQFFSGGPGLDCFAPNYTCYDLDELVDGERTALELIDAAVDLARRLGMYIVIDYHPVGGHDEADALAWWGEVAPRYADETHVLYELANEPVQWGPGDYTAADVAFEENVYATIRAGAPETHIILWTFGHLGRGMKDKVDEGTSIDYSNASVGFHPYGAYDLGSAQETALFYPVVQTEIGGTLGPGSYHQNLIQRTADHEALGYSWFWLNGAKTSNGPASGTDAVLTTEVTWGFDPGALSLDSTPPEPPFSGTGNALAWNVVELTWSEPSDPETGVIFYRVLRDGVLLAEPIEPAYLDTTALPFQDYAYTIVAVNGMGLTSTPSDPIEVTTPAPPDNPISIHWPFDAGFGSVATDATGLGQDGTVVSANWVNVGGEVALYFDGVTSYVGLDDSGVFMPIPGHSTLPGVDYTISGNFQLFTLGPRQPLVSKQGGSAAGSSRACLVEVTEDGSLRFEVSRDDGTGLTAITSDPLINVGTLYDFAVTYQFLGDGSSVMEIYLNGAVVASTSTAVGPIQANTQPLEVGREWRAPGDASYFEGVIDDVRIHNVALSAGEIAGL